MDNTAKQIPRMTAEEFFKTPETAQPSELLDGEIVNLASPSIRHQRLSAGLLTRLKNHVAANHGKCEPFAAPTDVRLNDLNVVQPDVFVTCHPENLTEQYLDGAPDFVCEIVSTNRSDDFDRKLWLYRISGVREYWIIDPYKERVFAYFFENGNSPDIYDFDTPIPVLIWNGTLTILVRELEQ